MLSIFNKEKKIGLLFLMKQLKISQRWLSADGGRMVPTPDEAPGLKSTKKKAQVSYLPFLRHWWSTSFSLLCYSDFTVRAFHRTLDPDFPFQHHGQRLRAEEPPRAAHMIPHPQPPPETREASTTPSASTHALSHTHMNSLTPPLTRLPSLPWERSCTATTAQWRSYCRNPRSPGGWVCESP